MASLARVTGSSLTVVVPDVVTSMILDLAALMIARSDTSPAAHDDMVAFKYAADMRISSSPIEIGCHALLGLRQATESIIGMRSSAFDCIGSASSHPRHTILIFFQLKLGKRKILSGTGLSLFSMCAINKKLSEYDPIIVRLSSKLPMMLNFAGNSHIPNMISSRETFLV
jgi:hypothetical protein